MKLFPPVSIICLFLLSDLTAFCFRHELDRPETSSRSKLHDKRSLLGTALRSPDEREWNSAAQGKEREAASEERLGSELFKSQDQEALKAHPSNVDADNIDYASKDTSPMLGTANHLRPRHAQLRGGELELGDHGEVQRSNPPFRRTKFSPEHPRHNARAINGEYSAAMGPEGTEGHSVRLPGQFWKSSKYMALLHAGGFGLAGAGIGAGFWQAEGTQEQAKAQREGNEIQKAANPTPIVSSIPSSSTSSLTSSTSLVAITTTVPANNVASLVQQVVSKPTPT